MLTTKKKFFFLLILISILAFSYSSSKYLKNSLYNNDVNLTSKELNHLGFIPAIGKNNINGYVKYDDLHDTQNTPENPEEALKIQTQKHIKKWNLFYKKTIPLYASDGSTIIGKYVID